MYNENAENNFFLENASDVRIPTEWQAINSFMTMERELKALTGFTDMPRDDVDSDITNGKTKHAGVWMEPW